MLDRRIHAVASMLAAGASRMQVLQTVANAREKDATLWGDAPLSPRTVDQYIHQAKNQIAAELEDEIDDRSRLLGKMWVRGEQLYAAAFAAKKYYAACQIWKVMIQLFGLEKVAELLVPPAPDPDAMIGVDGRPRLPMVEIVADGPILPSERRKALLEQVAQGAKDALGPK